MRARTFLIASAVLSLLVSAAGAEPIRYRLHDWID